MENSCCDEAWEVFVVPGVGFPLEGHGVLDGRHPVEVVRHVARGGDVGGRVPGSDPPFVVAEHHVHDPVQAIFHRPTAESFPEIFGIEPCASCANWMLPLRRTTCAIRQATVWRPSKAIAMASGASG